MLGTMVRKNLSLALVILLVSISISVSGQSADQLYAGGRQAFTDGLWPTASSQFSRLLREYPEDPRADSAAYMVAVSYFNAGEFGRSVDVLVRFPRQYPDSAWNRRVAYWEGLARYEQEDWAQAASAFQRQTSLREEPAYRERSLLYLGACRENLGDWKSAERAYVDILNDGRDYDLISRAIFRLGQIRLSDDRPSEALEAFNLLAYDYPASTVAVDCDYWIAESRRRMGQDDAALDSYRNFLATVYESSYRAYALLEAARLASKAHYDDEALAYLDLREDESNTARDDQARAVLRIRAASYMRTGQMSQARSAYMAILEDPEDNVEGQAAAFNLAQTWLGTDNVISAVPYLERASHGPDGRISADSLYLAGTILLHSGNSRGAEVLAAFAGSFPDDVRREESLKLAVRTWRDNDETDRAIEGLNILVREFPGSGEAASYLFLRGEIALESGDSSSALRDYGLITESHRDSEYLIDAHTRIAFIYAGRNEHVRAAGHYLAAADLAGGVDGGIAGRQAVYSAAVAYLNGGRRTDAIKQFDTLVRSDPSGPWGVEAAFHMGEALYDEEDYIAARTAYEKAARYGDSGWKYEALYGIGWTWFRDSNWSEAVQAFNRAADAAVTREQRARSLYRAGLSYASSGQWEDSLISYDEALSYESGNWREEALYQKAWAQFNLARNDEASETADLLAREYPQSGLPADLPFRMGENAMAAGDYPAAIIWFDKCRFDYPDSDIADRAELRAALAARESGDPGASAERYANWVLNRPGDPGAPAAARSWAEALKEKGDPDMAANAKMRLLAAAPDNPVLSVPVILAWARVTGIPEESKVLLEEIVENESLPPADRAEALLLRAHRYRMDGKPGRSRQLYEVLIRDIPGRIGAEAQEGLARSYADEGKLDESAEAYLAVPYLYPDQTDLASRSMREAEKLYREAGRDDEADKIRARIESQ